VAKGGGEVAGGEGGKASRAQDMIGGGRGGWEEDGRRRGWVDEVAGCREGSEARAVAE
jgi:hypothetical protein